MNCILGYPDILGDRPKKGSLSSGMKTTLFAPNLLPPIGLTLATPVVTDLLDKELATTGWVGSLD